jgi:uncharacterized membrane protein
MSDPEERAAPPPEPPPDPLDEARATRARASDTAAPLVPVAPAPPPDQDERLMAALAQVCTLLSPVLLGFALAGLIFLAWRQRSAYVRFQSAQALAFHLTFSAFIWIGGATVSGALSSVVGICLLPVLLPVLLGGTIGLALYSLWAAYQNLQGRPFRYAVLGELVADALSRG